MTASTARTQLLPLLQPASFCDVNMNKDSFCEGIRKLLPIGTRLSGHRGRLGRLADPNDPARRATKDPPSP